MWDVVARGTSLQAQVSVGESGWWLATFVLILRGRQALVKRPCLLISVVGTVGVWCLAGTVTSDGDPAVVFQAGGQGKGPGGVGGPLLRWLRIHPSLPMQELWRACAG